MPQAKPGDEGYFKKRLVEFAGKVVSFGNLWAVIATILLIPIWTSYEAGVMTREGIIDSSQWMVILMFVLGGRTLIKTVRNGNSNKG
jgi:hypothetical protein